MEPRELASALISPTTPLVREALGHLPLESLEALTIEALPATEEGLRQVVVDRVIAFVAQQSEGGAAPVAAYFTPTERRAAEGVTWSPFIAALASTEEVPDLRHTRTRAVAVPVREAELAEAEFADQELAAALHRLAAMDPPGHEDVLRVHLPTRQVTRVTA
ncbi:hypothetical protein OOK58_00090 [Streptomyces sp. NBC_01728]|uniref:hypothetical protein n=1 Tax=unclassified Streptomyces TaxID=2593676 RepID=UPI002256B018|nr:MULTISPECIES: hypothetical protein [unclassified Streptomyces]MCX4462472.1 hypothetical protein [Streptomyces sp. NBC_01719]MCX4490032.1 hypothetical protein [Streptomyces sp. NBC_01728]